jgi:hypothetical protein
MLPSSKDIILKVQNKSISTKETKNKTKNAQKNNQRNSPSSEWEMSHED